MSFRLRIQLRFLAVCIHVRFPQTRFLQTFLSFNLKKTAIPTGNIIFFALPQKKRNEPRLKWSVETPSQTERIVRQHVQFSASKALTRTTAVFQPTLVEIYRFKSTTADEVFNACPCIAIWKTRNTAFRDREHSLCGGGFRIVTKFPCQ